MLNPKTHSPNLPDSYYAASKCYSCDYPTLEGLQNADVCIIGGGFSGVNLALELAERGDRVILLEAFKIGWGASGRNGGQLIQGIGEDVTQFHAQVGEAGVQALQQMGLEAVELVRQRIKRFDIACDLTMGYCDLAFKVRHIEAFKAHQRWLESINYRHSVRLLAREEMPQVVGSDAYIGGLVDMGSGHLHPLNLVLGEAKAASEFGATIYEHSKVTRIDYGAEPVVHTAQGQVRCRRLVVCGNAYIGQLNKHLAARVLPAGSYLIATEPLPAAIAERVLPQRMAVCDQRIALDYYRLSADNRLLFGGLCTYSGRDPASIVAKLRPHMDRIFPYLRTVKIDYQWGGLIGIGANRMPQVGRLHENVYYAQAYAGHGINATHMAARVIAEHMHQESERLEYFENIRHLRFPGGRYLRSPLLAAGMLYYRAKDLL